MKHTAKAVKKTARTSVKRPAAGNKRKAGSRAPVRKISKPGAKMVKKVTKLIAKPVSKIAPAGGKLAKDGKPAPVRRKLTAAEIKEFRNLLLALRDRMSGQIKSLKSDSLKRADEVNTVEDGTDAFERQFALNIASTETDALLEIEEALRRIDDGTYGVCEVSGEPIEFERLKAIPYTRHSLAAQAELEKGRAPYRQSSVMRAL